MNSIRTFKDWRGRVFESVNYLDNNPSENAHLKFLVAAGFPPPSIVFDTFILDGKWREENRMDVFELIEWRQKRNSAYVGGSYVWMNGMFKDDKLEVRYAGKAVRLRNRLCQEEGALMNRWWDDFPDDIPIICAWLDSDNRAAMEARLIRHFKPRYNLRSA